MNRLCEIKVCTDSPYVHSVGGGMYHLTLNQTIPTPKNKLHIAVKNDIKMPSIEKSINFKLYFTFSQCIVFLCYVGCQTPAVSADFEICNIYLVQWRYAYRPIISIIMMNNDKSKIAT